MKITDFIEGKVTYDKDGQYFWVNNANEGLQMLAELRGWGRIQNMFQTKGKYDLEGAEKFQDELGEWVASAINEKLEREKEQSLLNKPAVIGSLRCILNCVEGGGPTRNKTYKILYKYKDSYCIIDDNDEIEVYNNVFFEEISNDL